MLTVIISGNCNLPIIVFSALRQGLGSHTIYQQGTQKLNPQYDKCPNCGREYVEKKWDSSTIKSKLFYLEVKIKTPKYMNSKHIF